MGAFGKGGSRVAMWRAGSALAGRRGQRPWEVARERAKRMSNVRDRMGLALGGMLSACALLAAAAGYASAPALAAGSAGSEGPCPNEQLRVEDNSTLLPDCRAYEMVTPPYKEGQVVDFSPRGVASDGESVAFEGSPDLAGIAGEGDSVTSGSAYLDDRGSSGWALTPLNPSLSEYVGQIVQAVEPQRGLSLWEQHTPAQSYTTRELYARSAAGAFTRIGPLSPPSQSAGEPSDSMDEVPFRTLDVLAATSDYGHVVLEASKVYEDGWPFDPSYGEGQDLYEYSGAGNAEPMLVGVKGERESRNDEGFACGTQLGSPGSAYNALSADGETVFFTALPLETDGCGQSDAPAQAQLWARVHGARGATAPAETIELSARSSAECTGACASSAEAGANFEGASEDGEEVFFTSTQQLLDGASQDPDAADSALSFTGTSCATTVGAGGCNLYLYNMRERRLSLVAGGAEVRGVTAIARDGSRVYFVARGALTGRQANAYGAVAQAGEPNLYVFDTATRQTTYIATLDPADETDWQRRDERPVQVTGEPGDEGRFLLFASARPGLTPGDPGGEQLFEYDADTGELVRLTRSEAGYPETGGPGLYVPEVTSLAEEDTAVRFDFHGEYDPLNVLSSDGRTVAFTTAARLSPRATAAEDGCSSVYEYRSGARIDEGEVHLLSGGQDVVENHGGTCGAVFEGMDATGANIFFTTDDPLLSSDVDGLQADIYDARVDGGFPPPARTVECEGEGCPGAPPSAPALAAPASEALGGGGNLAAPAPAAAKPKPRAKPKRKHRAGVRRCVKRRGRRRGAKCSARARVVRDRALARPAKHDGRAAR